ncbi:hypothetical protein GWK47_008290 [Chionoecetes opilio]|uniref:Uncharacterized protein n=1 Tax=Chionoecetes opilio TaxID=41210 RepID=A0A8J4XYE2_CHIOP|nr:hypothetical protein GWK47_008290 [Chionoecetes opilio]
MAGTRASARRSCELRNQEIPERLGPHGTENHPVLSGHTEDRHIASSSQGKMTPSSFLGSRQARIRLAQTWLQWFLQGGATSGASGTRIIAFCFDNTAWKHWHRARCFGSD